MKISFDYDGVLARSDWQVVAASLVLDGHEVYVLTARCAEQGGRVREAARRIDVPTDRVLFTCNRDKWETVDSEGIELHYDDNAEQLALIAENTDAVGVNVDEVDAVEALQDLDAQEGPND
jgi:hypothetical protein